MADPQDTLDPLAPPVAAAEPPVADPASAEPPAPDLTALLAAAEARATEAHDQWLRARAEMANIQRRADDAVARAHKFAVEDFARELLPVKDSLEAALGVQTATFESMKDGIEITAKQLAAVFEKFAVREVAPAVGEKLDPNRHQAMAAVPSDQPAHTVVQVFQKGYTLQERLLRPALVAAAKAPDA
jgi:molecular chaperone GrpE